MIELSGVPKLSRPVMVTAFEGWNDAADSATDAIEALEAGWDAKPLGALDPEDYYDFQVNRPTVSLVDGVSRRVSLADDPTLSCRLGGRPARHRARSRA